MTHVLPDTTLHHVLTLGFTLYTRPCVLCPAAQIWKLPSSLSSVRRGEEGYLRKVALADDVAELLRARNG